MNININRTNSDSGAAKRKNGDLLVDINQVIRNLTGVETDDTKKSLLQKLLEPEEVEEGERDTRKALQIAKKIARGESVTPQERELLRRVNPQLAQMAELARKEGERIKHALQQASSKEEQQTIVQQAYQQVAEVTKKNPQFGELLGEAVKAAIKDAKEDPRFMNKPEVEQAKENPGQPMEADNNFHPEKKLPESAEDRQEEVLQQFYPEERVSVMDCKG
ncbi:hypothetical protein C805_00225 [Eubacterium sp. 14-2]|uniref:hypothetical protein n=1 Tax=Eubacterium sp. 14-2 TaxID=1235790 RepID=UPI0003353B03|nr:hypothetical protein [Eubacterium sp. 14-2]EOT28704.1 hypothetical protein C805_00225 [Eubacterium sp. 14-2]